MNKTIKEQLDKMENHLNEALDNDLLNDTEFDMDEFQSKDCSFEREMNTSTTTINRRKSS